MKPNPLKLIVLLFSVSAAGIYVWHASSREKSEPSATPAPVTTPAEKSPTGNDFTVPMPARMVTDDEIEATKKAMLSTSKSGRIMSDEDIRSMLEKLPVSEQTNNNAQAPSLMGSSKSAVGVIIGEDVKQLINPEESEKKPAPVKPETLMRSSKSIDAILRKDDVKQLVEPPKKSKTQPNAEPMPK